MLYELKNEKFTAQVDSQGAQLVSLKGADGFEYLWVADPGYWGEHAPVLFPIVGALRENRAKIAGEWYQMGRHGFAKRCQFALGEREGDRQVSLVLRADGETKKVYPFDFALTVTYTLTQEGVETAFSVENTGDKTMPFAIGGHPGFNVPVGEDAAFGDYTIRFEKPETQRCPVIEAESCLINPEQCAYELKGESEIPLAHSLFYNDALVFQGLNSTRVAVVNKRTGRGVEMDFAGFPMLGIWSAKNDGPYVCLEPWTGCATLTTEGDDFEEKKGMTFLEPGQRADYRFSVAIR